MFTIDIKTCQICGGAMRIIAYIDDPVVIEKILYHLNKQDPSAKASPLPPCRAPPPGGLFD